MFCSERPGEGYREVVHDLWLQANDRNCFKCENLNDEMGNLENKGVVTLVKPQPGEAFENEHIAFMLTRFGINLELIDTDKKAKLIRE